MVLAFLKTEMHRKILKIDRIQTGHDHMHTVSFYTAANHRHVRCNFCDLFIGSRWFFEEGWLSVDSSVCNGNKFETQKIKKSTRPLKLILISQQLDYLGPLFNKSWVQPSPKLPSLCCVRPDTAACLPPLDCPRPDVLLEFLYSIFEFVAHVFHFFKKIISD